MNFTIGWRLLCADCGSNTNLMKCYEEVTNDHNETEERDFELCSECIEKREKEENDNDEGCDDLDDDFNGDDSMGGGGD